MARSKIVQITDDLGGAGEAAPVYFSVNGEAFVIDLNKRNHDTFMRRMQRYIDAASPNPPGRIGDPEGSRRYRNHPESVQIRQWAKEQGLITADRGRLPRNVVAAYVSRNA